jgi:uncharacterized protein YkwD
MSRTRNLLTGLFALALGAAPVALPASAAAVPTGPDTAVTGFAAKPDQKRMASGEYEKRLQAKINRVRRNHDLRPLKVRSCTDRFAERWAGKLARTGDFYHQDLGRMMDRCNLGSAGEILAKGNVTPGQMVQLWLASPPHRDQLLTARYRIAGVAARFDSQGNWVGCVDFGRH